MNKQTAQASRSFGRRREPHQIIIAQGESIRSFTLSPLVLTLSISVFVLFGVAYLGATTYLFFRDDLIGATLARQARMQHAYEDRIAALRSEIDRITSRQLLDQESFESKLDQLLARQNALNGRQQRVTQVIEKARKTGIHLANSTIPVEKPSMAPEAVDATGGVGGTLEDAKPLKSSAVTPGVFGSYEHSVDLSSETAFGRELTGIESRLENMVREQGAALDAIAIATERNVQSIEKVLGRLGVKLARTKAAEAATSATGGPFVPLSPTAFQDRVERAERALQRFGRLRRSAAALPLGGPVRKRRMTSRYGPRIDPFLKRPAMHTGIDFRGTSKTPVYATAKGQVKSAGRNGGYGRMIEIDHGNGLTTRYAHLSKLFVKTGQRVKKGQIIGRIGSTGRSTGPHLHYETRINGNAVNPVRYLKAGKKIAHLLK